MKLLFRYVSEYKKLLILALVLATINQGFSLLDPQIFRMIIDRFASHAHDLTTGEFLRGVGILLGLSVGVAFVSRVAKNFQDYYTNVITQKVGTKLYTSSIAHAFSLPYQVFEDERSGELLQKFSKARDDSQKLITAFINSIFLSVIGIVFVIIYAFTVHWAVGVTYLAIIPVIATITFTLGKRIKKAQQKIVNETASLSGSTTETIRNVELVKSLGLEEQEVNRLNDVSGKILALELKKVKLVRMLSFIQGTSVNAVRTILLFIMLWLIFKGAISVGQLFTLFIYSFYIFGPLGELGNISQLFYETKASLENIEKFLNMEGAKKPEHPIVVSKIENIEFKNVSFNYKGAEHEAVKKATFNIKNGEVVAFVGPSGSGKTTIIKLLNGLYNPVSGHITVNNVDMNTIDLELFRERIGLVLQETQLFAGTIRENLLFVDQNATDEECLKALKRAEALAIIERGREGLNTKIGEGGLKLSGGERQRLAIARALLRNPEIIIFDEATSALDSITEHAITNTIKSLGGKDNSMIQVLVAHRLSTVVHANRIFVLENGEIVESGSHSELLKKQGLYSALWREQGGKV